MCEGKGWGVVSDPNPVVGGRGGVTLPEAQLLKLLNPTTGVLLLL